MAKPPKVKPSHGSPAPAKNTTVQKQRLFDGSDILPFSLALSFLFADLLPGDKIADVMGGQWLYLAIMNILCFVFFLFSRNNHLKRSHNDLYQNPIILLYFLFFIIAVISSFFAMNKIESVVVLARISTTVFMLVSLGILLQKNHGYFKLLAQIFSIILLIQSISNLSTFFSGLGEVEINRLIYNLKGNAANKNILAAGLVIKIPFTIYCITTCSNWLYKLLHIISLSTGSLLIFILNARSAYLSLLALLILFIIFLFLLSRDLYPAKLKWIHLATILIPVLLSLVLSVKIIEAAIDKEYETPYGTVTERLGSIKLTAEGTNARLTEWTNAVSYISKHPFIGAGIGNWKLASIPYERNTVDELMVTLHAHNDFLEAAAETGIPGAIVYLLIFAVPWILLAKKIIQKGKAPLHALRICLLMALTVYIIDAFLNFPMERPVMQAMLCFILGFIVTSQTEIFNTRSRPVLTSKPGKIIGYVFISSLLLSAVIINYQVYKSLKVQTKVNKDMNLEKPVTTWQDIINEFPAIPNINMYCFPISHIKAFYLMEAKKYDEALILLNKDANVNPYLSLTEYLKGKVFFYKSQFDSAYVYAKKGFWMKPRARSNYLLLSDVCSRLNDTLTLEEAFFEYKRFRNDAWIWNNFIGTMINLGSNKERLLRKTDTAMQLFPNDTELAEKRKFLAASIKAGMITKEKNDEFQKNFAIGLNAFNNRNFPEAIRYFTVAANANQYDYVSLENIGVCYYSLKEYAKAISYINKVLEMNFATDGKAEFIKGLCLLSLGDKTEGCKFLKYSLQKKYTEASVQIANLCK